MSSTAHEGQFTDAPEPVRQTYDTGSILRRNVADLEIALRKQTERAEAAEAELLAVREDNHSMMLEIDGLRKELAKLREQEPVAWDCGGSITANSGYAEWFSRKDHGAAVPLYTSPVPAAPAVAVPAVPYGVDEEAANRIALAVYDCKHGINQEPLLYAINPCQCHCCRTKRRKARALLQSTGDKK